MKHLWSKLQSRKLVTFAIATALVYFGKIESGDWTIIACIYISVQGTIDMLKVKYIGA